MLYLSIVFLLILLWRWHLADRYTETPKNKKNKLTASVIIPTYNEKPEVLISTIASLLTQAEVIVVNDGGKMNNAIIEDIMAIGAKYLSMPVNRGKKHAQALGLSVATGDIIITVDSDTYVEDGAVDKMLAYFSDTSVGAVCGNVMISNVDKLNRLVRWLYWSSFNVWRAGHSVFGTVPVCSGAFSAYRKSLFKDNLEAYLNNSFLGRKVSIGDDRLLTTLVLRAGYKVRYANDAIAKTEAPATFIKFIKQQIRWSQSYWMALLSYQIPLYKRLNWYTIDTFITFATRVFSVLFLIGYIEAIISLDYRRLAWMTIAMILTGTMHAIYGMTRLGKRFVPFSFWSFFSLFVMTPIYVYSLFSIFLLNKIQWGTRK